MPCYNSQDFISAAIESVLFQTYPCWELIIIDDCSTDKSREIINSYVEKDSRISVLRTKTPSGSPTVPRNIGIENANGRFIAFLDSDDMWLPEKLYEQIGLFEDNMTAIVFSNYEKMSESGLRNERYVLSSKNASYKALLKGNIIGCLTAIYDTSKVGKMYFPYIQHEDYVLWLAILKQGYIAKNTNTVNAVYRVRNNSISSNKFAALSWQWNIYINIEQTGYIKGVYYFLNYAIRGFLKATK